MVAYSLLYFNKLNDIIVKQLPTELYKTYLSESLAQFNLVMKSVEPKYYKIHLYSS